MSLRLDEVSKKKQSLHLRCGAYSYNIEGGVFSISKDQQKEGNQKTMRIPEYITLFQC